MEVIRTVQSKHPEIFESLGIAQPKVECFCTARPESWIQNASGAIRLRITPTAAYILRCFGVHPIGSASTLGRGPGW